MDIKMVDLKGQYEKIKPEIDSEIQKVIDSTAFINGQKVWEFTENLSKYLGGVNIVPCANGTDALQIALMSLGLKTGDEVILPVHTYVATAEVIALLQLKPVFVDVEPEFFNIDVTKIEEKITAKTKVIVPVHLYGQCAEMEAIMKIAEKYKLFVIEDTAQAIGANYTFSNGQIQRAGTIGDIGTTSFFPSKNLGCYGDGGALFIRDKKLAEKCKMIANHGQIKKYHHELVGCNSRLDSIQAAVLDVKLKYLDKYCKARQEAAGIYDELLSGLHSVKTPKIASFTDHVYHQYTIVLDDSIERDMLQEYLKENGVPSMIYYPVPLHKQNAYIQNNQDKFEITEKLSESVLSLPMHTELTVKEQEYIINLIEKFINK